MSATLLCCLAALSAAPAAAQGTPIYTPRPQFAAAVRGQSPEFVGDPFLAVAQADGRAFGTYAAPPEGMVLPGPMTYDSYSGQQGPLLPSPDGSAAAGAISPTGPQPYRAGWTSRYSIGYLPDEDTDPGSGEMEIFEFDAEWQYVRPTSRGLMLSVTPQFSRRFWEGPDDAPGFPINLPEGVFRFGLDLEASTSARESLSLQVGFNPSINTDLEQNLTSDAYNWDGRAIVLYRAMPDLTFGLGLLYWDRVNDRVLPYAGIIYTPSQWLEYRLVFPNPRVDLFLGAPRGVMTWAYLRGEYHVEAYEVERDFADPLVPDARDKIEIQDWRVLAGLRTQNQRGVGTFLEAGWVFGREAEFLHGSPDFDIESGFITRAGWRF